MLGHNVFWCMGKCFTCCWWSLPLFISSIFFKIHQNDRQSAISPNWTTQAEPESTLRIYTWNNWGTIEMIDTKVGRWHLRNETHFATILGNQVFCIHLILYEFSFSVHAMQLMKGPDYNLFDQPVGGLNGGWGRYLGRGVVWLGPVGLYQTLVSSHFTPS